jgi:hypothetical protein
MRRGLSGLADDAATLLQGQLDAVNRQIQDLSDTIASGYAHYNSGDHWGGLSEGQFNSWVGQKQAEQAALQNKATTIAAQITDLKTKATNDAAVKTAAAAAVPPTPAQQAEAAAASADALETQMRLLSGPRYDFGAGSSARNKFFADVSNPRRGLGVDIFAAITQAVEQHGLDAVKGISIKDPSLAKIGGTSVPSILAGITSSVHLPGFLSDLKISAPNLSQLTHAVQQNIAKQRQAAASTSAPAVAPASHPVQLSPAHTWLWLGIGGAGLFLILRQLERRAA